MEVMTKHVCISGQNALKLHGPNVENKLINKLSCKLMMKINHSYTSLHVYSISQNST